MHLRTPSTRIILLPVQTHHDLRDLSIPLSGLNVSFSNPNTIPYVAILALPPRHRFLPALLAHSFAAPVQLKSFVLDRMPRCWNSRSPPGTIVAASSRVWGLWFRFNKLRRFRAERQGLVLGTGPIACSQSVTVVLVPISIHVHVWRGGRRSERASPVATPPRPASLDGDSHTCIHVPANLAAEALLTEAARTSLAEQLRAAIPEAFSLPSCPAEEGRDQDRAHGGESARR